MQPTRYSYSFPHSSIDPDALKIVNLLTEAGFEAYIVGGAVRDLLLGRSVKDFDIATNARPEIVKKIFRRNCRIIGRRFRLAHVFFRFGGKIYEVATFRKNPTELDEVSHPDDDLLIVNDNTFGSAYEDALRRDFTINALFYDCARKEILDWSTGVPDLKHRILRTIGNPDVRFREDPVRILRAIKFAARLDFGFDSDVYDAIVLHREELARAARARVFEEILRLLRGGSARRSMYLAWDTGVLSVLLPELSGLLDDDTIEGTEAHHVFHILSEIDALAQQHKSSLDDAVLFTALIREPIREWCHGVSQTREWQAIVAEKLTEMNERIAIPKQITERLPQLYGAASKLSKGQSGKFLMTSWAPMARDLALLMMSADGAPAHRLNAIRTLKLSHSAPIPHTHHHFSHKEHRP